MDKALCLVSKIINGYIMTQRKQKASVKPEAEVEKRSVRVETGDVFMLEKFIPITSIYRRMGPNMRYPFSEMKPGESFELTVPSKDELKRKVCNISSAVSAFVRTRNSSAKFSVRRTGDSSLRVWRLK